MDREEKGGIVGYTGIPGPVDSHSFGNVPSSLGEFLMIKLYIKMIIS